MQLDAYVSKMACHIYRGSARALCFVASCALCGCAIGESVQLLAGGDTRELRERDDEAPERSPRPSALLVLALDGVSRDQLYAMLRKGELPAFSRLLYGKDGDFPNAYFDDTFLATLPSSTAAAWVTAFTGKTPAEHGVAGNEFFIRDKAEFAAPIPVTFHDTTPVMATYTDEYVNRLTLVPTVYERMRKRDPHLQAWVAMHQLHRGADKLLVTDRAVLADAFKAFLETQITERLAQKDSKAVYAELDQQVIDSVIDELDDEDEAVPDVLTIYLSGADQFAHVAESGPDAARHEYLREEVDPLIEALIKALNARRMFDNRYIVVTADHGHTEVKDDDKHALAMDDDAHDPPAVLKKAGFRLRPFELEVSDSDPFDTVLAYQGAMAYVYVADRSRCTEEGCDWKRPPRFKRDVLAVAEAFWLANERGKYVPDMKGTLDMVLARKPRPFAHVDAPFQVYIGRGRLQPIAQYLASHPHPTYVHLEKRLEALAVGPAGERAGDVILIACNGEKDDPEERYYFSSRYRSWHGSPSKQDSEIPLIVAHPRESSTELGRKVKSVLAHEPFQEKFTDVLIALRYDSAKLGVRNAVPKRWERSKR
jgi:predicted AlkP superfamily pyrophosphatase or phosphodiesterase